MFGTGTKNIAIALVVILIAPNSPALRAQSAGSLRIEKGTKLALDLDTPVNSSMTREGDIVFFRMRNDIKVRDRVAIPQGTPVRGTAIRVTAAFVNGKPHKAEIRIRLDSISLKNGSALRARVEPFGIEGWRRHSALLQR